MCIIRKLVGWNEQGNISRTGEREIDQLDPANKQHDTKHGELANRRLVSEDARTTPYLTWPQTAIATRQPISDEHTFPSPRTEE